MDGVDILLSGGRVDNIRPIQHPGPKAKPKLMRFVPFFLVVVLPTIIASTYYLCFASPQYMSETQFLVRGESMAPTGVLSSLLQTAGGIASEDTYAVQDYMTSRAAAQEMIKTQGLKAVFNPPGADSFARFPNWHSHDTFESFYKYYDKHVIAELDSTTGISTLNVITFSPQDSQRIAAALLASSETLVNQMNARQRENTISSSRQEVADAQASLRKIGAEIAAYRNQQAMLDPNTQSVPMLHDISDLRSLLLNTQLQLSQLQASAPDSPLIPVYQQRVQALQNQIADSNTAITGSDTSLVPKITGYDDLTLQENLDEKILASATAAFEAAKVTADQQQIYIEEVVPPNLPDYPAYPKALSSVSTIFASLLGIYVLAKLIISGAREHQIV